MDSWGIGQFPDFRVGLGKALEDMGVKAIGDQMAWCTEYGRRSDYAFGELMGVKESCEALDYVRYRMASTNRMLRPTL